MLAAINGLFANCRGGFGIAGGFNQNVQLNVVRVIHVLYYGHVRSVRAGSGYRRRHARRIPVANQSNLQVGHVFRLGKQTCTKISNADKAATHDLVTGLRKQSVEVHLNVPFGLVFIIAAVL